MALKIDKKFERKLICCFKNDKNLVILIRAIKRPKNLHFDWSFPVMFDLKKCRGVIFHDLRE